ncbi:MAG TPA: Gfo/Idh/MocA family oxidoreductase [Chloroflexia bacterium]|nr:Gfo/Idh/MocA family oxidoreductase [Chloroflexia bacterium]
MKIGILSFAHVHAEGYAQNLRTIPGVEFLGLADDDPVRGRHYAQQCGAPLFPSYEALLAAGPDAVLVCAENSKHRPLVEMAAAAGVHVLCEKPLATTLPDAQALITACAGAGVTLMTAFPMRFSAPLREIKARLDAGELGPVYACNATNQGELPARHRAWFVDPALAGGGAVMDHTVHLVDILRWYLAAEVVEVYAQTNQILHAAEVRVETGGLLMLTFADGVFASIDCSWSKPDYYPTWGGLTFELVTARGAVRVDAFKQNLTVYRQAHQRPAWAHWGSDANQAMLEEFIAAIREERPPAVSGLDGLRALEVAQAAYASAASGQPVRLDRPGPAS